MYPTQPPPSPTHPPQLRRLREDLDAARNEAARAGRDLRRLKKQVVAEQAEVEDAVRARVEAGVAEVLGALGLLEAGNAALGEAGGEGAGGGAGAGVGGSGGGDPAGLAAAVAARLRDQRRAAEGWREEREALRRALAERDREVANLQAALGALAAESAVGEAAWHEAQSMRAELARARAEAEAAAGEVAMLRAACEGAERAARETEGAREEAERARVAVVSGTGSGGGGMDRTQLSGCVGVTSNVLLPLHISTSDLQNHVIHATYSTDSRVLGAPRIGRGSAPPPAPRRVSVGVGRPHHRQETARDVVPGEEGCLLSRSMSRNDVITI